MPKPLPVFKVSRKDFDEEGYLTKEALKNFGEFKHTYKKENPEPESESPPLFKSFKEMEEYNLEKRKFKFVLDFDKDTDGMTIVDLNGSGLNVAGVTNLPITLEKLNLVSTDIENLDLANLKHLRQLILTECRKLTSVGKLPELLEHIDLNSCIKVTDLDLADLKNLNKLSLYSCISLDNLNLPCDNLKRLNIAGCHGLNFTPELLDQLELLESNGCKIDGWREHHGAAADLDSSEELSSASDLDTSIDSDSSEERPADGARVRSASRANNDSNKMQID